MVTTAINNNKKSLSLKNMGIFSFQSNEWGMTRTKRCRIFIVYIYIYIFSLTCSMHWCIQKAICFRWLHFSFMRRKFQDELLNFDAQTLWSNWVRIITISLSPKLNMFKYICPYSTRIQHQRGDGRFICLHCFQVYRYTSLYRFSSCSLAWGKLFEHHCRNVKMLSEKF